MHDSQLVASLPPRYTFLNNRVVFKIFPLLRLKKNHHYFQARKNKYIALNSDTCLLPHPQRSLLPRNWNKIASYEAIPFFLNKTKAPNTKNREQNWECVRLIIVIVIHFLSTCHQMPYFLWPRNQGGWLSASWLKSQHILPPLFCLTESKTESRNLTNSTLQSNPE